MGRRLVVLRHAKSAWPDGVADHDRPLAGRGWREAPLVGRWMHEQIQEIDLVVCSSATRARQTWARAAEEVDPTPQARVDERLYAASARELIEFARTLPDTARTVVFVGHNPGLEDLVEDLSGTLCTLRTSSVAVLSGTGDWAAIAPGWACLETVQTPRP